MALKVRLDHCRTAFEIRIAPEAGELAHALEQNRRIPGARLQLRFGDELAAFPIPDLWSACCELLFAARLVRECRLDHFVLDVEQIFDVDYRDERVLCIFSREHVFEVPREEFAAELEVAVQKIFAATSCPAVMRAAADWGASAIFALPYSSRFSDSVLT